MQLGFSIEKLGYWTVFLSILSFTNVCSFFFLNSSGALTFDNFETILRFDVLPDPNSIAELPPLPHLQAFLLMKSFI